MADFPKGTAYTVIPLTPDKSVSSLESLASQVTSTPSGCYLPPAVSKDVLTADGTVLAVPEDFYATLGLANVVSPLRLRGLSAMLARIKRQVREAA